MTVVVVNCSTWHTFPSLVRTRALDLYPSDNGVEFWHAASAPYESDLRIWGCWPKFFGDPLWLLRDELGDLVSSHIATIAETMEETPVDPLVIIVVLDADIRSRRGNTATVIDAMKRIAIRIAVEGGDMAKVPRSLWRIAALRHSGPHHVNNDGVTAAAWDLVTPYSRPVSVDEAPDNAGLIETFDTAVLLDGGPLGGSDNGNFGSLRMLIDLARDQRIRDELKPGASRAETRVIKLTAPRIRSNPSDRILTDLGMLVRDYEKSPVRDEAGDPLVKLIDELQEKMFLDDEPLLSEAAAASLQKTKPTAEPDSKIEDVLRRYFIAEPPSLTELGTNSEIERTGTALDTARAKLEPFLHDRHRNLQAMRRGQDNSIRFYKSFLKNVDEAATDRSFGQSGRVLSAIENGLEKLEPRQRQFVARAEECRRQMNEEYRIQLEAAQAGHRNAPSLADFAEVQKFDRAATHLMYWLKNSTTTKRFVFGWIGFVGFYLASIGLVLAIRQHGHLWSWSAMWFAASVLLPAFISACWLFWQWDWIRKRRTQAITGAVKTYAEAVEHINKVTRLALAHLASSRVAGRIEPFTRTLSYREQDLKDLRTATDRVFNILRDSGDRDTAPGSNQAQRQLAIESKLKNANTQDSLKIVLSEATASKLDDVEITFPHGEMTGALLVRTALTLDAPLKLSFMQPPPSKSPIPDTPVETTRGPSEPSDEATRGLGSSRTDRSPETDPPVSTPSDARKSKRGKRSRN
jgi:hypothetical protein